MTWIAGLITIVPFIPHRTTAVFFRFANAILGLVLIGLGAYCAVMLSRHLPH